MIPTCRKTGVICFILHSNFFHLRVMLGSIWFVGYRTPPVQILSWLQKQTNVFFFFIYFVVRVFLEGEFRLRIRGYCNISEPWKEYGRFGIFRTIIWRFAPMFNTSWLISTIVASKHFPSRDLRTRSNFSMILFTIIWKFAPMFNKVSYLPLWLVNILQQIKDFIFEFGRS